MRKIILTISLLAIVGCSNPTEKSEAEIRVFKEKWKQESLIESNKDFQYLSLIVSAKTKVSKDTTNMILKEYYVQNNLAEFSNNTFTIVVDNPKYKTTPHKLDVMISIAEKLNLPREKVFLCFDLIDMHHQLEQNTDDIESVAVDIWSVDEKLDEVLEGKD